MSNPNDPAYPIPVTEIVAALERESANTDTDPRWLAATLLRQIVNWESRTLMCCVDQRPPVASRLNSIADAALAEEARTRSET